MKATGRAWLSMRDLLGVIRPIIVDRIEVLRAPQGTLYGRNSIGGALNIGSKRPTDTLQGEVRATAGNYETRYFEAALSGVDRLRAQRSPRGACARSPSHQLHHAYMASKLNFASVPDRFAPSKGGASKKHIFRTAGLPRIVAEEETSSYHRSRLQSDRRFQP